LHVLLSQGTCGDQADSHTVDVSQVHTVTATCGRLSLTGRQPVICSTWLKKTGCSRRARA
jgi:hypothetical protein